MDVVILNYNSSNDTIRLMTEIVNMSLVNQIVIVDNHSTEAEQQILNKAVGQYPHKVRIIFNEKNIGYAAGNNVGLKNVSHSSEPNGLVAIMNPDVHVEESELAGLIEAYRLAEQKFGMDSIGMISSWMTYFDQYPSVVAWKLPNLWSDFFASFSILNRLTKRFFAYKHLKRNQGIVPVDVLPGSLLVFNKKALAEIGYFDEGTFLYFEENIIASRLKKQGFQIVLDTDHCYYHEKSKTTSKYITRLKRIDYLFDSMLIYYRKEKHSKLQAGMINFLRPFRKLECRIMFGIKALFDRLVK